MRCYAEEFATEGAERGSGSLGSAPVCASPLLLPASLDGRSLGAYVCSPPATPPLRQPAPGFDRLERGNSAKYQQHPRRGSRLTSPSERDMAGVHDVLPNQRLWNICLS